MSDAALIPTDDAVTAALTHALGHGAPFTSDECSTLESLDVRGARELSFLRYLTGLRRLSIVASAVADLEPLRALTDLRGLRLVATDVSELKPLADCSTVEELEVVFTNATDLGPIIAMPALRRARLIGNPWSTESWARRSQLWEAARSRGMKPPLTEFSPPEDWQRTLDLRRLGFPLSFHTVGDVRPTVVRPGVGKLANSDCDFVGRPAAFVFSEIRRMAGASDDDLFTYWLSKERSAGHRSLDLESRIVPGSSEDALQWIAASQLPEQQREQLGRFVKRFPELTFYQDTPERLDILQGQSAHKVTFPAWLRALRLVLGGVQPWSEVSVQFDAYDQYCIRGDKIDRSWHSIDLLGYAPGKRELFHDYAALYPIGIWGDESWLCVSVNDESDQQVYEFNELDLEDTHSEGREARTTARPVFDSFASMLGHVIAVKIDDAIELRADG